MEDKKIEVIYNLINDYYNKYLYKHGVKLPKLRDSKGAFVKDALVLVYLARFYPNTVSVMKEELTRFIRVYYPNTNDVQQARHLGAQKGWFVSSGGRDNIHVKKSGEYRLITLERPYPKFKGHRIDATTDWQRIKQQYGNRCATCGSEEGQNNLQYPNTITKLQKSHIDPSKGLSEGNIIPQCQKCNRAYRNFWIFDERGRIREIANPVVVKKCAQDVKRGIYKILYKEFNGEVPNDW